MNFLVFGSLNIDMVYELDHIVEPGETITVKNFSIHAGGKGANQAAALARAGKSTFMAGKIGVDGAFLTELLSEYGANTELVIVDKENATGHGMIQLSSDGENAICVYSGTNRKITESEVLTALNRFDSNDILVLQNEISQLDFVMREGAKRGMRIAFNPAPFTSDVMNLPLEKLTLLTVNAIEAGQMTGLPQDTSTEELLAALIEKLPSCEIVLTLGGRGAAYAGKDHRVFVAAKKVNVVDTTGAGDTFIGYFLAKWAENISPQVCLEYGCAAAAIAVTKLGAMESIPLAQELS